MKKLLSTALLAAALLLPVIALASPAQQERPFQGTFAGTMVNKDDFSYTAAQGDYADYSILAGKSTMGNFTAHEVDTAGATGKECSTADVKKGVELALKGEAFVLTFDDAGDQLWLKLSPKNTGAACLDATNGVNTNMEKSTFDVMGGTGRFEGATGTILKSWKIIIVAWPASPGKGYIASFTGTYDGKIKLAK